MVVTHPFKVALEKEIATWTNYRRGLRPEDRVYFDKVMNAARKHWKEIGACQRLVPMEPIFLSVMVEQQRKMEELKKEIEGLV
ncbi:hypothetical protein [Candidatus Lokiarchaeum ossiferum]|uniref:hypothetical protein n=1 Tax=Candidatus Lokiarchaeum ossiferum TaxID=2951803 RepID=UPI00352DD583